MISGTRAGAVRPESADLEGPLCDDDAGPNALSVTPRRSPVLASRPCRPDAPERRRPKLYCFPLIAASISGITLRSFGRFAARFIRRIAGNPATRKVLAPSVVSRELATSSLKANPPEPE